LLSTVLDVFEKSKDKTGFSVKYTRSFKDGDIHTI